MLSENGCLPGIPSASPPRIDWDGMPLGQVYDMEIVEALGVSVSMAQDARRRRGIPPYRERRTCGCGREYLARARNVLGCSLACSQAAANHALAGRPSELSPLAVGLAALRREIKRAKGE